MLTIKSVHALQDIPACLGESGCPEYYYIVPESDNVLTYELEEQGPQ